MCGNISKNSITNNRIKVINIEKISQFIAERKFEESQRKLKYAENINPGFNSFILMSDIYKRENFHSDIIRAILDINGVHEGGNIYLLKFLSFINSFKNIVDERNYLGFNVEVEREDGRRDITIKGNRHAIIIENKLNDAQDTSNQIPFYVKCLEDDGFKVDAIIYLTLNQLKEPDQGTWNVNGKEKNYILGRLISIRAFDGRNDLCEGWLKKCLDVTNNIDTFSILRQYKKLLVYLTYNHMDLEFYYKFEEYLRGNPDNIDIAIGIKESLDRFPEFLINKLCQHFKIEDNHQPFNLFKEWSGICCFFNYDIAGLSFALEIRVNDLYNCLVQFSVRGNKQVEYKREYPEMVLKTIKMIDDFQWDNDGRFEFKIGESFIEFESMTKEFVATFLKALQINELAIVTVLSGKKD